MCGTKLKFSFPFKSKPGKDNQEINVLIEKEPKPNLQPRKSAFKTSNLDASSSKFNKSELKKHVRFSTLNLEIVNDGKPTQNLKSPLPSIRRG